MHGLDIDKPWSYIEKFCKFVLATLKVKNYTIRIVGQLLLITPSNLVEHDHTQLLAGYQ